MITPMGAPKGRRQREQDGERPLFVKVGNDVVDRLDDGARSLNLSRGAYIEHLIRSMPVDERGLPPWLADEVDAEQLPLGHGEEPERAAA
jgi:hypothetical protein